MCGNTVARRAPAASSHALEGSRKNAYGCWEPVQTKPVINDAIIVRVERVATAVRTENHLHNNMKANVRSRGQRR
jgi:hypothetical protein